MANPVPLNISTTLRTRDGTSTSKDARMTNVLVEVPQEGVKHFIKRPGFSIYDNAPTGGPFGATILPDGTTLMIYGSMTGGANNATIAKSYGILNITLDPAHKNTNTVLSNSNLTGTVTNKTAGYYVALSTVFKSTGKWYCEATANAGTNSAWQFGLAQSGMSLVDIANGVGGADNKGISYQNSTGKMWYGGALTTYGATWTTGAVISMLFDADADTVTFWKNGVTQGAMAQAVAGAWTPAIGLLSDAGYVSSMTLNYGARPFTYLLPAGYRGWN